jgi:flagellar basal-body rod protein FlgB
MTDFINKLEKAMQYTLQRHSVLSDNIMRINMPGQEAKDLETPNFDNFVSNNKVIPRTTHPRHINFENTNYTGGFKVIHDKTAPESYINGNNIVLEEQMQKVAANNSDYQMYLNIYKKALTLLKISTKAGS